MTDTSAHDAGSVARTVFAGLAPSAVPQLVTPHKSELRAKVKQGVFSTVPIVLVGSLAAMTLNLTGAVEPASAKPHLKPRGMASELGKTVREAMAAASAALTTTAASARIATAAAPATYTVVAGDTISDIAGRFGLSTASVLALNGLSWSSMIFPDQQLLLTASGPVTPTVVDPAEPGANRYTIVAGDTISAIADRFGVSTLSVLSANGLGWSSLIYPGSTLAIPGVSLDSSAEPDPTATAAAPESTAPVAQAPALDAVLVAAPVPQLPPTPMIAHTVQSGDTLSGIAAFYGIDIQTLLDANGLAWQSLIFPGDKLTVPGAAAAASLGGNVTGLNDEERSNAATIVRVGRELGVPDYGIVIALATAMQESTLRNLNWGDRDSVGLFQQRPSSGWGTVEQLTTPDHSARLFYGGPSNPNAGHTRGLLDISGWESMTVTQAAQAVQISAYPDAYAKWEASAYAWFSELG